MLIPFLFFGLSVLAVPGLAQTDQSPYKPGPNSVRIVGRFQTGIQEGVQKLQDLHAKREALKPTLEKEAEDIRKLKELARGDPSILETWKIRNRSKKFRVLAEEDQVLSQLMHQEWKIIREYARALVKSLEGIIGDFIQKLEADLVVHGQILKEDRQSFLEWAGQHSQYQELSLLAILPSIGPWLDVYLLGDWQVAVQDQGFMDRTIDKWSQHFEERILIKKDEIKALKKELRLRQRSDEIRGRTGGRLGLPFPKEEGPAMGRIPDDGPRDVAALQRMLGTAERKVEMTRNGLSVLKKLRKSLSEF